MYCPGKGSIGSCAILGSTGNRAGWHIQQTVAITVVAGSFPAIPSVEDIVSADFFQGLFRVVIQGQLCVEKVFAQSDVEGLLTTRGRQAAET
jgi:hypothetical protein